jgi:pyruvate/2-oxoglutarate dehydrogenase complex dihydrolipoamide dehydrogenase (E3) component
MRKFDAIIIGTGQSGKPLALSLAREGWKVAVIEERYVGGTCINYGCTPTKAMVNSAKAVYSAHNVKQMGVKTGKVSVDFKAVMARKDKIVKSFRESGKRSLENNKNITMIYGTASFTAGKEIEIKPVQRKKVPLALRKLKSDHIFIDTGAKPVIPKLEGLEKIKYLTSESILHIKQLPEHLLILGGGYVAVEFAQMFRRFGSRVTIIEHGERFLAREDEDISGELKKILESEGIKILTGTEVNSVKQLSAKKIKLIAKKGSKRVTFTGSHLLVAVGIAPSVKKLNLPIAGIKTDNNGFIKVNKKLETNIKGVYALGDVNGGPAFTHISYDDYRIVFENIINKGKRTTTGRPVPYVLFTDPELGRIGLTEQEALRKKIRIKTASIPMTYSARAIESGETKGLIKAVADAKSGKIIGASVLGMYGGEIMSIIEVAVLGGLHYKKLKDAIFAHPTLAESLNTLFTKLK